MPRNEVGNAIMSTRKIKVRFVKLCESGGESPLSLGGWSARNST